MKRLASLALLAVLTLSACGSSATPNYYTLNATAAPGSPPLPAAIVLVAPVTVPAAVDQPQMVTEAGGNRVQIEEFNRWAEPLNDNIAQVVAENLSVLLGTPSVATAPLPNLTPGYLVSIQVQQFESMPGQAAALEAFWTVSDVAARITRSGRTRVSEPVQDDSLAALAAAHSRALAQLSQEIATALRAEAAST
ncbi:MAG TPA: PqiC family protein [Candidatus Binataceae bacterium]|jgi:uncharacterized lipoprotein YmbA|nr:PqiC family protein [Candidatus Binataceae bacterium]